MIIANIQKTLESTNARVKQTYIISRTLFFFCNSLGKREANSQSQFKAFWKLFNDHVTDTIVATLQENSVITNKFTTQYQKLPINHWSGTVASTFCRPQSIPKYGWKGKSWSRLQNV